MGLICFRIWRAYPTKTKIPLCRTVFCFSFLRAWVLFLVSTSDCTHFHKVQARRHFLFPRQSSWLVQILVMFQLFHINVGCFFLLPAFVCVFFVGLLFFLQKCNCNLCIRSQSRFFFRHWKKQLFHSNYNKRKTCNLWTFLEKKENTVLLSWQRVFLIF